MSDQNEAGAGNIYLTYRPKVWYDNRICKLVSLLDKGELAIPAMKWQRESRGTFNGFSFWVDMHVESEEQAMKSARALQDVIQVLLEQYG